MSEQNTNEGRDRRSEREIRAERIKGIFRAQARTLAALFPKDGMTLVTRSMHTACQVSMSLEPDVTAESIASAAIACHHLGLEVPDHAYIYPHRNKRLGRNEAKLTIGPRGLILLAYNSGFVKSIVARSVFEGDEFEYNLGDNTITHRKAVDGRRPRGRTPEQMITHAYVLIDTRTEGRVMEVLTWEDIAFYRSFSKASTGPWLDNFEGMARKTALKRGLEFVPRSPLLSAAMRENEESAYEIPEEILAAVKRGQEAAREEPEQMPAAGYAEQEGAA